MKAGTMGYTGLCACGKDRSHPSGSRLAAGSSGGFLLSFFLYRMRAIHCGTETKKAFRPIRS